MCSALSATGETPELIATLFIDDDPDTEGQRKPGQWRSNAAHQ
jgi:hypothetical protein